MEVLENCSSRTNPDFLGSLLCLPLVSKVSLDLEEDVPKGLVIVVVPIILKDGSLLRGIHRAGPRNDPPEVRCMKEILYEGCPGQVIWAVELGDSSTERGGGEGGHIEFSGVG